MGAVHLQSVIAGGVWGSSIIAGLLAVGVNGDGQVVCTRSESNIEVALQQQQTQSFSAITNQ